MGKTKALLLAGGIGSRLRPLTNTTPKCLVEIGGKPLLDYWLDALDAVGVEDVLLNTHHLAAQVRSHIEDSNARRALQVTEFYEPELLGSAGTISENSAWMDDADNCFIIYADNLSTISLPDFVSFHQSQSCVFTMALFTAPDPTQCGIATLDDNANVVAFVEKPENPTSDLANAGLYCVSRAAWREIAAMDAFDLGFDVLPHFVNRMKGFISDGYHRDIGTPSALEQANTDITNMKGMM